ncbi:MAG: MBL fold metallo-hydrolase [archaeon]|nr:MBL fold metallo-hydrolase [archaeon]
MIEVHILASGSDGNCAVYQFDDEAIMIDSGLSYRYTHKLMEKEGVDEKAIKGILVTHEHSDHVGGLGPMARKLKVPVFCNEKTFYASRAGDVDYVPIYMLQEFSYAGFQILPVPTSHDAIDPCAYMLKADGKVMTQITDTGELTFQAREALALADLAVMEANYDYKMLRNGPYSIPLQERILGVQGHMDNRETGYELKHTMDTNRNRKVFLAHISKNNNTPDLAKESVSKYSGIPLEDLDCLKELGDTRTIRI